MTTRRPLTRAQKVRIFDLSRGRCHLCGLRIRVGEKWDVEHIKPLWLDGADGPENMAPAHIACHQEKTSGEASDRAKTDAQRANYLGIPKPGKKMRGHRGDDITITFNRGVQPRVKERGAKDRAAIEARYSFLNGGTE